MLVHRLQLFSQSENAQFRHTTATSLTKLMNRNRQPIFDTRCRLDVEYGEVIADVDFVGVTDHPETAFRVKIAVTSSKPEHTCLNAHHVSYTSVPHIETLAPLRTQV